MDAEQVGSNFVVHNYGHGGSGWSLSWGSSTPDDFAKLREKTLINATGYGARALCGDQSLTPVRGQLARLIPQPEVNYGLFYNGVSFLPRRDGLVFQVVGEDDYYGFNDDSALPDRSEADLAVNTIAGLFSGPALSG